MTQLRAIWIVLAQPGRLSPYTLDGYWRAWRAFFNWCIEQELIGRSPARKLRRPPLPDQDPKAIGEDDLLRLLGAAQRSRRDYALICFLASSGCRVGGLVACQIGDVDLDTGRALVTEKGRGGGKQRTVYLSAIALAALTDYVTRNRRWGLCNALFLIDDGSKGLTADGVRSLLRRLARRAHVAGRFNPHSFRHRFARVLLANGCDLGTTSQLMGHRSVNVTVKFYARWCEEELHAKHAQYMREDIDRKGS